MNTETGEIRDWDSVKTLGESERKKWIPVERDLTVKERADKQIRLYAPCGCGSGKKFKFCCRKSPSNKAPTQILDENKKTANSIE